MGHALCLLQYLTSVVRQSRIKVDSTPIDNIKEWGEKRKKQIKKTKMSLHMRVWKGRRFENILKLDRDLR